MVSTVFYYIWNVLSLGLMCAFKVAVRKGIVDAEASKAKAALVNAPRKERVA